MNTREQAPVWVIWGLVALFGVVEATAWILAGGIPTRPGVLAQVITAWVVIVILASLATRRLGTLAQRIRVHEHTHRATLDEIEQLQTQNAVLEIIARSVDVTLAFQALASRIARMVPCDRVGLALLSENGQEFQTYTARVVEEERRSRPRPEIVFKVEQTVLGGVLRTREALIIGEASPEIRARTYGAYYLIRDCIVTTGSFLGAWLWSIGPQANFIGAAVCGALGTVWFWWFVFRQNHTAQGA